MVRRRVFLLFFLVIVVHIFMRAIGAAGMDVLRHDDAITILSASQNMARFEVEKAQLINRWQLAETWISFSKPQGSLNFLKIQEGLNSYDIHPPLYFWIMAIMIRSIDSVSAALFIPNILFSTFTIILLFATLRIQFTKKTSLIGAYLFAFTPALAGPYIALRQYDLLMLATGALLYFGSHLVRSQSSRNRTILFLGILISCSIGVWTQALFVIPMTSIILAAIVARTGWRTVALFGLAFILSVGIFVILNSGFLNSFFRYQTQLQGTSGHELLLRLEKLYAHSTDLVGLMPLLSSIFLLAILSWAIATVISAYRQENIKSKSLSIFWISFGLGIIILYSIQYLSMNAPVHAIGRRYFLFWLPGLVCIYTTAFHHAGYNKLGVFSVLFFFFTSANLLWNSTASVRSYNQELKKAFSNASAVYVNNPARGVVTPIILKLRKGQKFLVTSRSVGERKLTQLLNGLSSGDIVVMEPRYFDTKEFQKNTQTVQSRLVLKAVGNSKKVFQVM